MVNDTFPLVLDKYNTTMMAISNSDTWRYELSVNEHIVGINQLLNMLYHNIVTALVGVALLRRFITTFNSRLYAFKLDKNNKYHLNDARLFYSFVCYYIQIFIR